MGSSVFGEKRTFLPKVKRGGKGWSSPGWGGEVERETGRTRGYLSSFDLSN